MKDRYTGDPALCAKRVRRSTALMAARSRRRGHFPLPRTAADICVRSVRKGPAIRFQVIAADGPSRTIHCVRLPSTAGNWRSRWTQGTISCADNADGADGLAPPSSGALVTVMPCCSAEGEAADYKNAQADSPRAIRATASPHGESTGYIYAN
jgi:hypothetical protein